jgi:hypothetical protein
VTGMTGYLIIDVTRARVTSITGKPVTTCHSGASQMSASQASDGKRSNFERREADFWGGGSPLRFDRTAGAETWRTLANSDFS